MRGFNNSFAFGNQRKVGAAPSTPFTLMDLFEPGDDGGIWNMANSDVFTTHNGSTPSGQGDPVGYVEDLSGLGNHLTQPDAAKRPVLSTRVSEPMQQLDLIEDCMEWPFNGTVGGFACRSMHGISIGTIEAGTIMPAWQIMEAVYRDRPFSDEEATNIQTLWAGHTTHDMEVITTQLNPNNYSFGAFVNGGDFEADHGSTIGFTFETSSDSALFPPWTLGYYGNLYMDYVTGLTPREYADVVITTPAALKNLAIGWYSNDHYGKVFDLTTLPSLEVYQVFGRAFEGFIPPATDWPASLKIVSFGQGLIGNSQLEGIWPDNFDDAPCKTGITYFQSGINRVRGTLNLTAFTNLENLTIAFSQMAHVDAHGLTSLNYFYASGSDAYPMAFLETINCSGCTSLVTTYPTGPSPTKTPALHSINFNGCPINQTDVDAWLAVMVAIGNTGGVIDLRVAAGITPTGAGLADKATLEGTGNTVFVNS